MHTLWTFHYKWISDPKLILNNLEFGFKSESTFKNFHHSAFCRIFRNKALFSSSAFKAMSPLKHDAYMILLKEQEKA